MTWRTPSGPAGGGSVLVVTVLAGWLLLALLWLATGSMLARRHAAALGPRVGAGRAAVVRAIEMSAKAGGTRVAPLVGVSRGGPRG